MTGISREVPSWDLICALDECRESEVKAAVVIIGWRIKQPARWECFFRMKLMRNDPPHQDAVSALVVLLRLMRLKQPKLWLLSENATNSWKDMAFDLNFFAGIETNLPYRHGCCRGLLPNSTLVSLSYYFQTIFLSWTKRI